MAINHIIGYMPNPTSNRWDTVRWDTGTQGNWVTSGTAAGTANYWNPYTGRQYQVPLTFVHRPYPTSQPRSEPNDDGKELFTDSDLDGLLTE